MSASALNIFAPWLYVLALPHAEDWIKVRCLEPAVVFFLGEAPLSSLCFGHGCAEPLACAGVNDAHDSKIGQADSGGPEWMSSFLKHFRWRVNSASLRFHGCFRLFCFPMAHVFFAHASQLYSLITLSNRFSSNSLFDDLERLFFSSPV